MADHIATTELVAAATVLRIDVATVPIVDALEADHVPTILLKGPAIASWLYGADEVRPYCDIDLLVPVAALSRAERVLSELGFAKPYTPRRQIERELAHGAAWVRRRDGMFVDLHVGFSGLGTGEAVWEVLSDGAQQLRIAGGEVRVPSVSSRALIVALHALQHAGHQRCMLDLERCVERCPPDEWLRASLAAERLGAGRALSRALRLLPAGRELLEHLPLDSEQAEGGFDWTLAAAALDLPDDRRRTSVRVASLLEATGRRQARLALNHAVPSPRAMRVSYPLARRGWTGLAAAYLTRLVRRTPRLVAVLWALHSTRRAQGRATARLGSRCWRGDS